MIICKNVKVDEDEDEISISSQKKKKKFVITCIDKSLTSKTH